MMSRRRFLICSAGVAAAAPGMLRAAGQAGLKLGLIADPQFADRQPTKTRFYRYSLLKLTEAIDHFNSLDLDACINLGDLIDGGWSNYDHALRPFARSRHAVYHVLGNHDFDVADEFKPNVPGRLGVKTRYAARRFGQFCLVRLDTNDVSSYAHGERTEATAAGKTMLQRLTAARAANAQPWNGGVGSEQLAWFERTCARESRAGRRVVVCAHHPVFPSDAHNAWNSAELLTAIERHRNVVAWLNGHNHAGAFGTYAGVPCITLKGMVETADTSAFAVLRLYPDRLELDGHGREPSRELPLRKT